MLLNFIKADFREKFLVDKYLSLISEGVNPSEILILVQNSTLRNQFTEKVLSGIKTNAIERLNIHSFFSLVYNTLNDNWCFIENSIPSDKSFILPNLVGLEVSQFILKDILKDILITSQPVSVVIENILEKVSFTFGVTAEHIKSEKRDANINSARQAAMYIIREITNLSQEEVGKVFGRNHSTVNSSLKNVQQKMSSDQKYKNLINDIIKNIND